MLSGRFDLGIMCSILVPKLDKTVPRGSSGSVWAPAGDLAVLAEAIRAVPHCQVVTRLPSAFCCLRDQGLDGDPSTVSCMLPGDSKTP